MSEKLNSKSKIGAGVHNSEVAQKVVDAPVVPKKGDMADAQADRFNKYFAQLDKNRYEMLK